MKTIYQILNIALISLIFCGCSNTNQKATPENNAIKKETTIAQPTRNSAEQIYKQKQIPVLCYHRIEDGKKGDYTVSTATFNAHIKALSDSGYHSVLPGQLYDYLVYNKALPEKPVMITFDDSRVEHAEIAAPVLEKYGFRGVFFIMTITYNKKNYMTTDQIADLAKAGHVIGLHSWDHTMVTKYNDPADWDKEVVQPKAKLEKIINMPVEYWAYPNGVFDHKGAEELSKYFKLSFSLSTKRDSLQPLQTVRRMIAPDISPNSLLKSMRRIF